MFPLEIPLTLALDWRLIVGVLVGVVVALRHRHQGDALPLREALKEADELVREVVHAELGALRLVQPRFQGGGVGERLDSPHAHSSPAAKEGEDAASCS